MPEIRNAVYASGPDQPVYGVRTIDEVVSESMATRNMAILLLGLFAGLALLLPRSASMELCPTPSRRTQEIGIRMALGADKRHVFRMIIGQGIGMAGEVLESAQWRLLDSCVCSQVFLICCTAWAAVTLLHCFAFPRHCWLSLWLLVFFRDPRHAHQSDAGLANRIVNALVPAKAVDQEKSIMQWWHLRKRNEDLEREIRSDLELEEEEQRDRGLSDHEARFAAQRAFGNAALVRDRTHEAWGWTPFEHLWQDVRFGTRSLLKSRQFTIAAVLTLALGIGTSTSMFSVIRSVLLKPWPFQDPGSLVSVSQRQADGNGNLFSTQDFLDWKEQGGLLARMGTHVSWQFNLSSPGSPPERISGGEVSSDLLPLLGVKPILGRVFSASDDLPELGISSS